MLDRSKLIVVHALDKFHTLTSEEWRQIRFLQEQVIRRSVPDNQEGFYRMYEQREVILLLAVRYNGEFIGLVQGTRIINLISSKVFVDSVATHPDWRGKGVGRIFMSVLESSILYRWPDVNEIILTNGPQRGNGGFYKSLGYKARADERPLVRLAKKVSDWFSKSPDETFFWRKQIR